MSDTFTERRTANPQGVIDDLIKQTSLQAKAIHDLNKDIARLTEMLTVAGIDSTKPPEPKPKGRKKKTDGVSSGTDS